MKEWIIASHNDGKVREIALLLEPHGIQATSAKTHNLTEPEENGVTFTENAEIKARAAACATGKLCLADDSGLVVPVLDGAPGIYSARWAVDESKGGERNFLYAFARIQKELEIRAAHPEPEASFVCVLCLAWPDGKTMHFEGRVDGTLTFPPRGSHGFGYDPIFIPKHHSKTFAEMDNAQKADLSHRKHAMKKLIAYIQEEIAA